MKESRQNDKGYDRGQCPWIDSPVCSAPSGGHFITADIQYLKIACERYDCDNIDLEVYDTQDFYYQLNKKYKTRSLDNIVNDLGYDEVNTLFLLDESFKCFSNESRFFNETHDETKNQCQIICTTHGENLCKEHPLGYKDGQLLIGFYHNTPNNTLPIFWSTAPSWTPIFKRYRKRK